MSSRRNAAAEDLILMIHGAPAVHREEYKPSCAGVPPLMCTYGGAEVTDYSNEMTHKNVSEVSNAKPAPPADKPAAINRQYKDRLFKFLFGNPEHKEWTLSLYNAVNGTDYSDPDDIFFTTIENSVYMGMKNDVSLLLADTMNFYEQQSTYNPNMPMRFLVYAGMVFSAYIEDPDNSINIFSKTQQKFPVPRLVCFYNGTDQQPDQKILHLTDAFERPELSDISLDVTMLNINADKNRGLMTACQPLREYADLLENIRRAQKKRKNIEAAIDDALDAMPDNSLIKPFIIANKAEVKRMFITEYDEAATLEKFKKEYLEQGLSQGLSQGTLQQMEKDARGMYEEGIGPDVIARILKIPVEDVEVILGLKKAQNHLS
jgi:hypothetical protein